MALLKATLAPPSSSSSSSPSSFSSSPSPSPLSSLSSSSSVSFGQGKHGHRSPPLVRFSAGFTPTLYQGHQSITRPSIKSFGTIKETIGSLTDVEGLRFAMVVGRFNEFISKALLSGALEAFKRHGIKDEDMEVVWVPGSFEIPIVAQTLAKSGKFDAILCIGVVIRGDTTHYDEVANAATSGVLSAGLNSGVPCIFGVLTCETLDQAINRAGGKAGNKGAEAAITAIEMATLFKHHLKDLASSETKSTCVSISV